MSMTRTQHHTHPHARNLAVDGGALAALADGQEHETDEGETVCDDGVYAIRLENSRLACLERALCAFFADGVELCDWGQAPSWTRAYAA